MKGKKVREYVVEDIIDFDGKLYTIKWKGYSTITKEPIENLTNCAEILEEFHKKQELKKAEKPNTHVTHMSYKRGKGEVILETPTGRKSRTFKESLNTDALAVAEYLENRLVKT